MLRLRANVQLLRPKIIKSNLFATISYYDSQSGIQVTRGSDFSLHCTSTGVRTNTRTNEKTTFIPVTSLKDLPSTDEQVGGVSLEITMTTFLEQRATLVELIKASNYLDISSLLELSSAKVATMIKGKPIQEIRDFFNIVNDFSPEEEAQVREENKWCEET